MHTLLLVAGLLLTGTPDHPRPGPAAPPTTFQFVLTPIAGGFTARCDSGCSWVDLAFECPVGCTKVIDANGVYASSVTTRPAAAFAFRFHRTAKGWEMESLGGTLWESLGWGCGVLGCAARVTERGVSSGS